MARGYIYRCSLSTNVLQEVRQRVFGGAGEPYSGREPLREMKSDETLLNAAGEEPHVNLTAYEHGIYGTMS